MRIQRSEVRHQPCRDESVNEECHRVSNHFVNLLSYGIIHGIIFWFLVHGRNEPRVQREKWFCLGPWKANLFLERFSLTLWFAFCVLEKNVDVHWKFIRFVYSTPTDFETAAADPMCATRTRFECSTITCEKRGTYKHIFFFARNIFLKFALCLFAGGFINVDLPLLTINNYFRLLTPIINYSYTDPYYLPLLSHMVFLFSTIVDPYVCPITIAQRRVCNAKGKNHC